MRSRCPTRPISCARFSPPTSASTKRRCNTKDRRLRLVRRDQDRSGARPRASMRRRPKVEKQWRAEQVDKALATKADDLVKQLNDGRRDRKSREERRRGSRKPRPTSIATTSGLPETLVAASSASPRTARARQRFPTGAPSSRSPPTARPQVDFADLPRRRRRRSGSTRDPRRASSNNMSRRSAARSASSSHENVLQSAEGG